MPGEELEGSRHRIPLAVWAAVALHVGVMLVFTLVYPVYWGFDESGHVSRVLETQHGLVAPTPGADQYSDGVRFTYSTFGAHDQPPFLQYQPLPRSQRPSFATTGDGRHDDPPNPLPNQLAQHPPGYYLLAAGFLDVTPGSSHLAWDQTIGWLRFLDIALLAPLPLIFWAIARRYVRPAIATAVAFTPLLVPTLERVGGSVTNSDALILAMSLFLLFVARVLRGDLRLRTAAGMGTAVAAALWVKGFGLVLPPVALLAYVVAWRRARGRVPWAQVGTVVAGSAAGGAWWLRNLVVLGTVQPSGLTPAQSDQVYPPLPPGTPTHLTTYARLVLDKMTTDFWGALGLATPPSMPGPFVVIATTAALLLVVAAFAPLVIERMRIAGRSVNRDCVDYGVLLLPTLLVAVLLVSHAIGDYRHTGQAIGVVGRYLLTGLAGSAVVVAAGLDALLARFGVRFLPAAMCVAGLAIEGTALVTVLEKLWLRPGQTLLGSLGTLARGIGAQSPWPGPMTLTILALAALSVVAAMLAVARDTTRTSSESPLPERSAAENPAL